jgi:hypothetical protein
MARLHILLGRYNAHHTCTFALLISIGVGKPEWRDSIGSGIEASMCA